LSIGDDEKMRVVQGQLLGKDYRFALVVSRFNELITGRLLEGAKDALIRHGVSHQNIDVYWTPGSWELPLTVKELALSGRYDAIVALGAVIRGDTPHFDYIASEMSKGLANVGLGHRVPVSFGVLTCDDLEQALQRAGSKAGNKGAEAAVAAIEMADLLNQIRAKTGEA